MVARLVAATCKRHPEAIREELARVGRDASVHAALRFDPATGPFEAFAFSVVRAALHHHLDEKLSLGAPVRERAAPRALVAGPSTDERSAADKLADALERTVEMDRDDIVLEMRLRVAGAMAELHGHPETALSHDSESAAPHDDRRLSAPSRHLLEVVSSSLGEPERTVYQRLYHEDRTLAEIAEELGVSARTAQRIGDLVRAAIDGAVRSAASA